MTIAVDLGCKATKQTMLIYNSQRFKHNFTPDMLFHLESLEKKANCQYEGNKTGSQKLS